MFRRYRLITQLNDTWSHMEFSCLIKISLRRYFCYVRNADMVQPQPVGLSAAHNFRDGVPSFEGTYGKVGGGHNLIPFPETSSNCLAR